VARAKRHYISGQVWHITDRCHKRDFLLRFAKDRRNSDTIPKSIQLVAGRTARECNERKGRKGAYREDRYHATAIETGDKRRQIFPTKGVKSFLLTKCPIVLMLTHG